MKKVLSYQTDDEEDDYSDVVEEDNSLPLSYLTEFGVKDEELEYLKGLGVCTCKQLFNSKMLFSMLTQAAVARIKKAALKMQKEFLPSGHVSTVKDEATGESSKEVLVTNLPYYFKQAQLEGILKKYGKGVMVEPVFKKGLFQGCAKALYQSSQDARKALALNGSMFFGRELKLEISGNDQKAELPFVVVKRLPGDVTANEVKAHFSEDCGDPTKVNLPRSHHKHRMAFIYFDSQESIDSALLLSGSAIRSHEITVELGKAEKSRKVSEGSSGSKSGPIRHSSRAGGRAAGGRPY